MTTKTTLAIILIAMLLADSINGLKWQGTGSGMNNTVLTEIWTGLEANLNTALTTDTQSGYNSFCSEISLRLTNRWDKAWNVVLATSQAAYDTVLYGYAFNNQWMWFNGLPNSVLGPSSIATLIVWKDYNCQDWKSIGSEASGFSQAQKDQLTTFISSVDQSAYQNDIWGIAFNLMSSLERQTEFSSGAYSVIMSQDADASIYGRVCMVGSMFSIYRPMYESQTLVDGQHVFILRGVMYLFRTR